MSKNSFKLFLAAIAIGICFAGRVPGSIKSERKPILDVDPISARALLNNDFESGFEEPWYDSSPSTVHWIVEDFSLQSELNNPVPAPSAGSKYLRAIRNQQLSSGLLILRTVTFTALPGDEISFNFWIRSRYTGGNTLDLVLVQGGLETTLLSLSSYSTSVNLEWRPTSSPIPVTEPTEVTLVFYAYCGGNVEDAIAIDDIVVGSTIPTTTIPPPTTPLPGVCGGNFSEPSGIFSSPNYPNPYDNNEICEYTIQVAEGNRIVLNFLEFNTESGADYVTVYDGLSTASPVLVRVSGLSTDLLTTSSGSGCLVVHTSDGVNSSKGWSATYATA
ncbi:deleted in malignant brain tumors 1 protein-like [Daphnia pulex]|uniref:deleted in malignant brain tumors 1 protein-like n=1 Tax=Daphnia pulex TaxID=6669 RepID=UPI001EE0BCF3|nr:deleted in malignant brain tumors 1 protein-like [Daphnia pulex]